MICRCRDIPRVCPQIGLSPLTTKKILILFIQLFPFVVVEGSFAHTHTLGCYLHQFIGLDILRHHLDALMSRDGANIKAANPEYCALRARIQS